MDDGDTGRVGRAFTVRRDDGSGPECILKLWRDDQPDLAREVNSREAERLREGMERTPRRMPQLVEAGEWRGLPF